MKNLRPVFFIFILVFSLAQSGHGESKTIASSLPDTEIKFAEASSLLPFEGKDPLSVPKGMSKAELIKLYSEDLVSQAGKAGLSVSSLQKCLKTHCQDVLPYAAFFVKIKGKQCWLIATKKIWANDPMTSGQLAHYSVYLIDASNDEILSLDGCYCF